MGVKDDGSRESLFPLALTPFEKFVLWDERPEQPMTIFVELHFDGHFDVACMQRCLKLAARRNPLFTALVSPRDGDLWWEVKEDYEPDLRNEAEFPPLLNGRVRAFDLFKECGGRFWYRRYAEDRWRLLIQAHHACADGVGLRRFLIDALKCYAEEKRQVDGVAGGEGSPGVDRLQSELLKDRFDFSAKCSGSPAEELTAWQRWKNAYYFHCQLPEPIHVVSKPRDKTIFQQGGMREEVADNDQPLRHVILPTEYYSRSLVRARDWDVGINEIALAILFKACYEWNTASGLPSRRKRIRLLMPYDLRSRVDLRMPAANRLSFAFLGRRYDQCESLAGLITSVKAEIEWIKATRLPLDFLAALQLACGHPRLMRWLLKRGRNMATSVLTYTGDVSRGLGRHFPQVNGALQIGDLNLVKIVAAPPVRENTNVALGLCVNWGQICISAAWNRGALSASQCDDFLAVYCRIWEDWLQQ